MTIVLADVPAMWAAKIAPSTNGCWHWTGTTQDGYGVGFRRPAHREVYEQVHGLIPTGLVLDHRCHTDSTSCFDGRNCQHRRCVNPNSDHLEAVTHAENLRRINTRKVYTESQIGAVLQRLGVSQTRFAELIQQDHPTVSRWATGVREPRRRNKIIILRALRDLGWQGTSNDLWPVDTDDERQARQLAHRVWAISTTTPLPISLETPCS